MCKTNSSLQLQHIPSGCAAAPGTLIHEEQVEVLYFDTMAAVPPALWRPPKEVTIRQGSRQLMWRSPIDAMRTLVNRMALAAKIAMAP